jgi:nickel transport protein
MTNRPLVVLLALGLVVVSAGELSAHGITVVLERRGDLVVAAARYDGGIPVSGAEVVIRGPDDSPYQTGQTDGAGLFAFVPAEPGEWQVMVDDGMGHRRVARLMMEPVEPLEPLEPTPGDGGAGDEGRFADQAGGEDGGVGTTAGGSSSGATVGTVWRLATGLSLLFGLTGFGYGYTARRRQGAGPG